MEFDRHLLITEIFDTKLEIPKSLVQRRFIRESVIKIGCGEFKAPSDATSTCRRIRRGMFIVVYDRYI